MTLARFCDGLRPSCHVSFCSNDPVIHAISAAEVSYISVPGVDADTRFEWLLNSRGSPPRIKFEQAMLHAPSYP
jgi:hypothetical protein